MGLLLKMKIEINVTTSRTLEVVHTRDYVVEVWGCFPSLGVFGGIVGSVKALKQESSNFYLQNETWEYLFYESISYGQKVGLPLSMKEEPFAPIYERRQFW